MRKFNVKVEMEVLASICNSSFEDRKFKYLGMVRADHFGSPSSKEIYNRLIKIVQEGKQIPSFAVLADDPRLSSTARQLVSTSKQKRYRNEGDFNQGVTILAAHFKARQLAELNQKISDTLTGEGVEDDFSSLEDTLESTLFKMRTDGVEEKIYSAGVGKVDLLDLTKRVLNPPVSARRFKTGWGEFDEDTGGLEPGNVMLITANTGGGKSVAALTAATNMFRGHSLHVTYISLEMNETEVQERLLANATGFEFSKIHKRTLSQDEKRKIYAEMKRFNESSTGSFRLYAPKNDYTIEQLFSQVQSAKNDVIILDYLGLVRPGNYGKNTSEEYQLRQMTRFAKRAAERMGCAIILLAQLNDEGNIMYSKGIGHHVHYWLKWFYNEDVDGQKGFVTVENGKSRNAKRRNYYFTPDFAHMRMDNIEKPPGLEESQQEPRPQGRGIQQQAGHARRPVPGGQRRPMPPPKPTNISISLFDTVE